MLQEIPLVSEQARPSSEEIQALAAVLLDFADRRLRDIATEDQPAVESRGALDAPSAGG